MNGCKLTSGNIRITDLREEKELILLEVNLLHSLMLLQFILLLFLTTTISASSPGGLSYHKHCNAVVHEAIPITTPCASSAFYIDNGYFTGGKEFFPEDADPYFSLPRSFFFRSNLVCHTESPGIIKLEADLTLQGSSSLEKKNGPQSAIVVRLSLSGFWSEASSRLCMVGSGACLSKEGKNFNLSAVLKLDYPKISNISTSLVSGELESLDATGSFNHFNAIALLGYAYMNYDFTLIPSIKNSFHNQDFKEEPMKLNWGQFCRLLHNNMITRYSLERQQEGDGSTRRCGGRPLDELLGFSPTSMFLNNLMCTERGEVAAYLSFSNPRRFEYINPVTPNKTLFAEGLWDEESTRVFLSACPVVKAGDDSQQKAATVGDCSIWLSLWFPSVFSIRRRSTVTGRLWSKHNKTHSCYFNMVFFRSNSRRAIAGPGLRYEYSVVDKAHRLCSSSAMNLSNQSKRIYPEGNSMNVIKFGVYVKNKAGKRGWFHLSPLTIGNKFVDMADAVDAALQTISTAAEMKKNVWNVSYSISYQFEDFSPNEPPTLTSAEGIYNSESGMICMVGRQDIATRFSTVDVVISVQVPPLDAGVDEKFNGSIWSLREKLDPFHFEPLEIYSYSMGGASQAMEMEKKEVDMDVIVMLFFCSLVTLFMGFWFFCRTRHRRIMFLF